MMQSYNILRLTCCKTDLYHCDYRIDHFSIELAYKKDPHANTTITTIPYQCLCNVYSNGAIQYIKL